MKRLASIYLPLFLPFVVSLILATLLAWSVAVSLLTLTLDQGWEQQLKHAAWTLAEGGLPVTENLLSRLGRLLQADVLLILDSQVFSA